MTTPNPFRPNKPVVPGMFAGRGLEIRGIAATLDQTRVGNAGHILIEESAASVSRLSSLRSIRMPPWEHAGPKGAASLLCR